MRTHTVYNDDYEVIATDIPKEQVFWLRGMDPDGRLIPGRQALIRPHKKQERLWFALAAPAVIVAELLREISLDFPFAAANFTLTRVPYVARNGHSGWYHEHSLDRCLSYRTYSRSANEMARLALRHVLTALLQAQIELPRFRVWFRGLADGTQDAQANTRDAVRRVQLLLEAFDRERLTVEQLFSSLRALAQPTVEQRAA